MCVRKQPGEKISDTENKMSFMAYNPGGKNLTPLYFREKLFYQRFGGKKILTQTNSHMHPPPPHPPSKVKWSAPKKSSIGHRLSSPIFKNVDKGDETSQVKYK